MAPHDPWYVLSLETTSYQEAWDLQLRLVGARQQALIPDVLILLQHPHTYTLGRRATLQHLLLDPPSLAQRGIMYYWVDRGGDITYHGPGQLVGYPIMDLRHRNRNVHQYLRGIEAALILALARYGLKAERDPAYTGVWVASQKIAAIGVKISRGVTSHGFALNVNTDLSYFRDIVPCGIADREVTSLEQLLGQPQDLKEMQQTVVETFTAEFAGPWRPVSLEALLEMAPPTPPARAEPTAWATLAPA